VFGQEPGDGGLAKRGLDPAHRSTASRASVEVGTEDVSEQPRPALARRGAVVVVVFLIAAERSKRELVARRGGRSALGGMPGPYLLQAGIAACHARARTPEDTDWRRIVAIYEQLAATEPSPIVELNRAVAISFADGPAAALAIVDGLANLPALAGYHLVPAVRADFLSRLGRRDEARAELERAASLAKNDRERALLLKRAAATQD
jgi:predicted RNA polymerase sigma factor